MHPEISTGIFKPKRIHKVPPFALCYHRAGTINLLNNNDELTLSVSAKANNS